MRSFWETPSSVDNHHREADDQHRRCEQLASRKWTKIEPNVGVRLAHKLHCEPEHSVKTDPCPRYGPRNELFSVEPLHDHEQHQAFEKGFVKLRRMTRCGAAARKYHAPRHAGFAAKQ